MHLAGPELTTTNYKKRVNKITRAQQEEIERGWRERNQRLKAMGLPKETLEQYTDWLYGRGKKEKKNRDSKQSSKVSTKVAQAGDGTTSMAGVNKLGKEPYSNSVEGNKASLGLWITGPVSSKPTPTYTGTKIKGIGVMHKSNMVPIFSDDEAVDIARMRR